MKVAITFIFLATGAYAQNLAIQGDTIYTMVSAPITNGIVLVEHGKIIKIGLRSRSRRAMKRARPRWSPRDLSTRIPPSA
ncbi:MAG: hypothetical protein ACR2IV_20795 [Bryobacteraceae bacterium]